MRSAIHLGGHPVHPMLITLPIGLWVTSLVFDLLGRALSEPRLWSAGFYCAVAGCVGGLIAAVPGALDYWKVVPPRSSAKSRGLLHGLINVTVLVIFAVVVWRRGSPDPLPDNISLGLSFLATAALGYSGWLGGTLAYRNQIGVDRRYANAGKVRERAIASVRSPVCNTGELSEGQMMLVKIGSERVVVGRCATGIVAFADRCTHKGGSLADGALVGCAVQCPWHGSQFDVHTGRVVTGPAEKQVRTYAVEIRDHEVYVRSEEPGKGQQAA